MSAENGKAVDLRGLQNRIAGKVQLDDGEPHDVHKLNGVQYQLLKQLEQSGDGYEAIDGFYALAAEVVPSVDAGQVRKLNTDVIKAILAMASTGVEAVRAMFPNAESPEIHSSTSPG